MGNELTPHQQKSVAIYRRCKEMTRQLDTANSTLSRDGNQFRIVTLRYTTKEGEEIQDVWHFIDFQRLLQFTLVSAAMSLVYPTVWENGQSRRGFSAQGEAVYKALQEAKDMREDENSSSFHITITDIRKTEDVIRKPSLQNILVRLLEWRAFLQRHTDSTKRRGRNEVHVRYSAPSTTNNTDVYSQINYVQKSLTIPVSFLDDVQKLIGHLETELALKDRKLLEEAHRAFAVFLELKKTMNATNLPIDDLAHLQNMPDISNLVLAPYKDVDDNQHPPVDGEDKDNW